MHVLHAERIWMQGVLLVYVLGGWCWREYAVSLRPGVPGMRGCGDGSSNLPGGC